MRKWKGVPFTVIVIEESINTGKVIAEIEDTALVLSQTSSRSSGL